MKSFLLIFCSILAISQAKSRPEFVRIGNKTVLKMARLLLLSILSAFVLVQSVTSTSSLDEVRKIVKQHALESKGFVILGGRNYYFPPTVPISAIDAITICNDLGMTLAGLETKLENDEIKAYVQTQGTTYGYWTSGNRYHDRWMWTNSGHLFSYTDWEFNEPNESASVDACVMVHGLTAWSDAQCDTKALYICEQI